MDIPKLEPTGAQVRAARAYLSLTQAAFAEQIGIGLITLLKFERDKRAATAGTRNQLGLGLLRLGLRFDETGNLILPPDLPE